jgi:hypothetical protein
MAQQETTNEQRPYVRYKLTVENTSDAGMGYSVKHGIQRFFKKHGIVGKVTGLETTGNGATAIIELFSNERGLDFNARSIAEGIKNWYPSEVRRHPTIRIEPLPCDFQLQVEETRSQETSYDGLEQITQSYESALKSAESEIEKTKAAAREREKDLEDALVQRQGVIGQKDETIRQRDKEIVQLKKAQRPASYDNPLESILRGYVAPAVEVVFDAFTDYTNLEKNGDLETLSERPERVSFSWYVNRKLGTKFNSDEELFEWSQEMSRVKSWDETKKGSELKARKERVQRDYQFLKDAEEKGVSPELLAAIKSTISDDVLKAVDSEIETHQRAFSEHVNLVSRVEGLNTM